MGCLGPIVGQLYPGTLIVDLVVALVLFSYLSILYKENPAYTIVENIAISTMVALMFVASVGTLQRSVIPPLLGGDATYMIPVLFGLLYFAVFGKGLWRTLFRVIIVLGVGRDLAFSLARNFPWCWMVLSSYARLTDMTRVVMLILLILGITYFFFGQWLEGATRPLRSIGIYTIYAFVPTGLVTFLLMFSYDFLGMLDYIVRSPAVIVPIALLVWIITDRLRS